MNDGPSALVSHERERLRRRVIAARLGPDAGPSQRKSLMEALGAAVVEYAGARSLNERDTEDLLQQAVDVVDALRAAAAGDGQADAAAGGDIWRHERQPLRLLHAGAAPRPSPDALAAVAATYLRLPVRSRPMDRILVDALVAGQLYAYGRAMRHAPAARPWVRPMPPQRWRPARAYVKELIGVAFVGFAGIVLGLAASRLDLISYDAARIASLMIAGAAVLVLGFDLARLPGQLRRAAAEHLQHADRLERMAGVYAALRSGGYVSAPQIRQAVNAAAQAGVAWPPVLFALLDDVNARDGWL